MAFNFIGQILDVSNVNALKGMVVCTVMALHLENCLKLKADCNG